LTFFGRGAGGGGGDRCAGVGEADGAEGPALAFWILPLAGTAILLLGLLWFVEVSGYSLVLFVRVSE